MEAVLEEGWEAASLPWRPDLVGAWLQKVEVKPQPQSSRREERRGRRRKRDESGSGEAGARAAEEGGELGQGYFCPIIQGQRAKLTGQ